MMLLLVTVSAALISNVVGQEVATGLCPEGWIDGTASNATCYFYPKDVKVTWLDGRAFCKQLADGSFLVEPTTHYQFDFVTSFLDEDWREHYVGTTDAVEEGRWLWLESMVPVADDFWGWGEPNNKDGNEHCATMYKVRGVAKMNDHSCSELFTPICEIRPVSPVPTIIEEIVEENLIDEEEILLNSA